MWDDEDIISLDRYRTSLISILADRFIYRFFTMGGLGILSPRKHPEPPKDNLGILGFREQYNETEYSCELDMPYHCGWFTVIPITMLRSFLVSCLSENDFTSFCEYQYRKELTESASVLYMGLVMQLDRLGVKNPYITGKDYLLIATIPIENSNVEENFPHDEICKIYKPKLNGNNVFGISANKKLEGKYSSLILFNNLSDVVDFCKQLNAFYYLVNCNNVLNVEYFNLNNYYKPLVYSTNKFSFSDDKYLENGVNIDLTNTVQEYHFQKDENISIITANYSLDFMNDVFHYSSFGQSYYPGKLLSKIIKETGFDFTNVVVERDCTGQLLFLIDFKNGCKLDTGNIIDQETDYFISNYYRAISDKSEGFVAIDIWDLAKKYYEYIKFKSDRDELNDFDYFNIGNAYCYLEKYISNSVRFKIVNIGCKQIVASNFLCGTYMPVELQAFQYQDYKTSIISSNLIGLKPDNEKFKEIFKVKSVRLVNVYRKNTFFESCSYGEDGESKHTFYTNAGVVIIGVDKTQIHELDKKLIEELNDEMVYVRSDGTVMQPFENGKLQCPVSDFYLDHCAEHEFDDLVGGINYRRYHRMMFINGTFGDQFESLKLTKICNTEDLITVEELYEYTLAGLKPNK